VTESVALPAPPAEEAAVAPKKEEDPRKSPMTMNAWLRLDNRVHNFAAPKKLNKFSQAAELDLLFNAQIIEQIGLTANLVGTYGPSGPSAGDITGSVSIMDLIAKFDLHDAFHVWAGRMLVPSDRANFAGPWFMAPWNYPGFFVPFAPPLGPREGPSGRNDGATIWGQFQGGMLKYYAGTYDLFATNNPLLSGRINLALINPEPGYYHSSTYYGSKDILALAIGGQYKKKGGKMDYDYSEFNADLLFEKNLNGKGVLDVEGAFYKYFGAGEAQDYSYYALASYLTPDKLGPGALQPLLRLQQAKPKGGGDSWTLVDAQIGYVIDTYAARLALVYQYSDVMKVTGHSLSLGIQLQK
jgi:hypothetical protein